MNEEVDFENKGCMIYAKECDLNFNFSKPDPLDFPPILNRNVLIKTANGVTIEIKYSKIIEFLEDRGFEISIKNLDFEIQTLFMNTDLDFYEIKKSLPLKYFYTYYIKNENKSVLTKFKELIKEYMLALDIHINSTTLL